MKYTQAYDGEWIEPKRGYKVACCDCGLIHKIEFRISPHGKIQFRAFRDNRATAARRHRKRSGPSKIHGKYLLSGKTAEKFGL